MSSQSRTERSPFRQHRANGQPTVPVAQGPSKRPHLLKVHSASCYHVPGDQPCTTWASENTLVSIICQLDRAWKPWQQSLGMNCLYQTGLWAHLCRTALTVIRWKRTHSPGYIRKQQIVSLQESREAAFVHCLFFKFLSGFLRRTP